MGRDKATLEVGGRAMAVRVAEALLAAGAHEVMAIGGDAGTLRALGLAVVADDEPGEGPFPATLTALRHASTDVVVVLACDLVAPNPAAIGTLVGRLRAAAPDIVAAVPVIDGHHQWTHVAWRRAALAALEEARRAGAGSLRRACEGLALEPVTELMAADLADADQPRDLPGAG